MKKLILILLAFVAFFNSFGSHQAAADIYYDYISPLTYRVHLIIYRDCTGISQGSSEPMTAYSASLGACQSFTVDTTGFVTGFEVGSLCPNVPSQCTNVNSTFKGYQEWHFSGEVILPAVAKDWEFSWNGCCRNSGILNMSPNGMSVWALLNNVARPINSSVRLLIKPIPYVCLNQPQVYLNGPYDPDNDSIHFESNWPFDSHNSNCANITSAQVTYIAPYTYTVPLSCSASIYNVNAITGTAAFQPNALGQFVLGFRVYDIDRITHDTVGMIMRDVQINVVNCASPNPIGDTIGCINPNQYLGTNHLKACAGALVTFCAKGYSLSGSNNLHGMVDLTPTPGATMTFSAPGAIVTGNFSWTANGAGPHVLLVEFDDSTCTTAQPIVLKGYTTVIIDVLPGVSGGGPYNYCPGGDSLHLQSYGPPGMNIWSWQILPGQSGNPNFSNPLSNKTDAAPTQGMFVEVTGLPNTLTGCPNKDTVYLNVHPAISLAPGGPYNICANENVTLNPVSSAGAGGAYTWTPATYLNNTNTLNPICTPLTAQNYTLNVIDPNGCKKSIQVDVNTIGIKPIIDVISEKDPVCAGEPFKLFASGSAQPCGLSATLCNGSTSNKTVGIGNVANGNFGPFLRDFNSAYRAQYLIRADELLQAGMVAGNIKGITLDVLTNNTSPASDSLLNFKVKIGCTPKTALDATAGFTNGLTQVFSAFKFAPTVGNTIINFPTSGTYFWDGQSNLIVEFCYGQPNFGGGTPAEVNCSPTSYNSALLAQDFNAGACSLPATFADVAALRPNFKFNFCKGPDFTYAWSPVNVFNNNTLANPTVTNGVQGSTTFGVVVTGGNPACFETGSVSVQVDNSGSIDASVSNAHICDPGLVTLLGTPTATTVNPIYTCGDNKYTVSGASNLYNIGAGTVSAFISPFYWSDGAKFQYVIPASELTAAGMNGGPYELNSLALNVLFKGSSLPYGNFSIKLGCTSSPNITGLTNIGDMKTVYSVANYNTTTNWNTFNFQNPFLWNGQSNLVVEICYFSGQYMGGDDIAVTTSPLQLSYGVYSFDAGCDLPLTGTYTSMGTILSKPTTRITGSKCAPKPFDYVWQPSLFVYDTTAQSTLAYVTQSGTYQVSLLNKTGCKRSDTVNVNIELHDVTVTPTDTSVCPGDVYPAFVTGTGTGLNPTYQWLPANADLSCSTCTAVFITPTQNTIYSIIRTDEFNCKDTAFINSKLFPKANFIITNGDSIVVPYNSQVQLEVLCPIDPNWSSMVYNWTPGWALSNPNIHNPNIQPTQSALYKVYGIDSNNCRTYDSIYVTVDQTNPVAMPTVFTPNGDGNNNKFRIFNYKFEKVQEFKVFTRWGQEVFSGNNNDGWDGTFNGQPMDMDTYTYLIRLAYPDGNVKTIKGDVVLVR
jgi:gliding motility-associated-like protein